VNTDALLDRAADKVEALHVGDLYGDAFEDFRSRYKKEQAYGLYVQFTSHAQDPLDRNPYGGQVDHRDPAAVYGYPIEYVLKHPADVWYGTGARYLRVLRDKARHKLVITDVDHDQAVSILQRMGIQDKAGQPVVKIAPIEGWMRAVGRKFSQRLGRTNRDAKLFFLCAQQQGPGDETILAGTEQSARFRRAGFDAIEDTAKRPGQAVINDREPAQIAFLTRHAFEVVETVHLTGKGDHVGTTWNTDRFERRLAAEIADLMDDRLAEGPERSSLNGWSYWWTRKGRRIETLVEKDASFYEQRMNDKWGSKPHKSQTVWTPHHVKVAINTEFGRDEVAIDSDERTKDLWRALRETWQAAQRDQPDPTWLPENHAAWKARQDEARVQRTHKRLMQQEGWKIEAWDRETLPALERLAGHALEFHTKDRDTLKIGMYDHVDRLHRLLTDDHPASQQESGHHDERAVRPADEVERLGRAWTKEDEADDEPSEGNKLYRARLKTLWDVMGPVYRARAGQIVPRNGHDFVKQVAT
jgi:hypothetical protein